MHVVANAAINATRLRREECFVRWELLLIEDNHVYAFCYLSQYAGILVARGGRDVVSRH